MLERLAGHPQFEWQARRAADWQIRPADSPPTRYEEKARAVGRPPTFLQFIRRNKGLVG
jgi:tRNA (guanine-N7-)-methyltransferase